MVLHGRLNLTGVTDRSGRVSTLQYGEEAFSDIDPAAPYDIGEHVLTSVTAYPDFKPDTDDAEALDREADGLESIRVSFDRDGLLAGIRDASGAAADFGYTLDRGDGTTVETVADDSGFFTEVLRDGEGNTLRTVQQLEEADEAGNVKYLATESADGSEGSTRYDATPPIRLSSSTFNCLDRVPSLGCHIQSSTHRT